MNIDKQVTEVQSAQKLTNNFRSSASKDEDESEDDDEVIKDLSRELEEEELAYLENELERMRLSGEYLASEDESEDEHEVSKCVSRELEQEDLANFKEEVDEALEKRKQERMNRFAKQKEIIERFFKDHKTDKKTLEEEEKLASQWSYFFYSLDTQAEKATEVDKSLAGYYKDKRYFKMSEYMINIKKHTKVYCDKNSIKPDKFYLQYDKRRKEIIETLLKRENVCFFLFNLVSEIKNESDAIGARKFPNLLENTIEFYTKDTKINIENIMTEDVEKLIKKGGQEIKYNYSTLTRTFERMSKKEDSSNGTFKNCLDVIKMHLDSIEENPRTIEEIFEEKLKKRPIVDDESDNKILKKQDGSDESHTSELISQGKAQIVGHSRIKIPSPFPEQGMDSRSRLRLLLSPELPASSNSHSAQQIDDTELERTVTREAAVSVSHDTTQQAAMKTQSSFFAASGFGEGWSQAAISDQLSLGLGVRGGDPDKLKSKSRKPPVKDADNDGQDVPLDLSRKVSTGDARFFGDLEAREDRDRASSEKNFPSTSSAQGQGDLTRGATKALSDLFRGSFYSDPNPSHARSSDSKKEAKKEKEKEKEKVLARS